MEMIVKPVDTEFMKSEAREIEAWANRSPQIDKQRS